MTQCIDVSTGERHVERGTFRRVYDELGKHIGYQPVKISPADFDVRSQPSTPAISEEETASNAGLDGRSKTASLDELAREKRIANGLDPEDFIERAIEKVRCWTRPAPGKGDRAVRVYPKEARCKTQR